MRKRLAGNVTAAVLTLAMAAWASDSASAQGEKKAAREYRRHVDPDEPPTGHTARSRWAWCSNRTAGRSPARFAAARRRDPARRRVRRRHAEARHQLAGWGSATRDAQRRAEGQRHARRLPLERAR